MKTTSGKAINMLTRQKKGGTFQFGILFSGLVLERKFQTDSLNGPVHSGEKSQKKVSFSIKSSYGLKNFPFDLKGKMGGISIQS